MAKKAITGVTKVMRVRVNGRREAMQNDRSELIFEVGSQSSRLAVSDGTHQEASRIATIKALRKAHREDVTDLTIESPNALLEGHMAKNWRRTAQGHVALDADIAALTEEFDSVKWITAPSSPSTGAAQTPRKA